MPLRNIYNASSAKPGDVFVAVVTCHITERGYRLYRCAWPPQDHIYAVDDIPQGSRINEGSIIEQLFPLVGWVDLKPDF